MNQLNQKISAIRVQIEAEKKIGNWGRIRKLESELRSLLDQVDVMK